MKSLETIINLLEKASHAGFYYEIRRRYASTEQWKYEEKNIMRAASTYWFSAKKLICDNISEAEVAAKEVPIIEAALKVIKKESDSKFEDLILKGGNVGKVKSQEELFDVLDETEEYEDEDALYASETEGFVDPDDEDNYDDEDEEYLDEEDDEEEEY